MSDLSSPRWRDLDSAHSPRAVAFTSIAQQLREIQATDDEVLALLVAVGLDDTRIISMLTTLTADVTWDESVTYHAVLTVGDQVAALQADVDARLAAILAAIEGPPAPGPPVPQGTTAVVTIGGQPVQVTFTYDPQTRTITMSDVTANDNDTVSVTPALVDVDNEPTAPEAGSIAWSVDANATITPSADGSSATATFLVSDPPQPLPATTTVTATVTDATADNVAPFTLTGTITWDPSAPVSGTINLTVEPPA